MNYKLHIQSGYENRSVEVKDELSIGRTGSADLQLDDAGLSRINTTFFIDDGALWVADENSTNGTFLNGAPVAGRPMPVKNGDHIKIGSDTTITVDISAGHGADHQSSEEQNYSGSQQLQAVNAQQTPAIPQYAPAAASTGQASSQTILLLIGGITLFIFLIGGIAVFIILQMDNSPTPPTGRTASSLIPQRVIDPLGGENEEDLDDLIASWEVAEEELNAADVADITGANTENSEVNLNVSAAFLAQQQQLAMAARTGPTGIRPAGLQVPKELFGDGVIKQTRKLREMRAAGYQQPLDFADLAHKRMNGELMELPMAEESYYLDVGGSARDTPFTSFSFSGGNTPIVPGHPKFDTIRNLADNFAGQKYDLENAAHRKQIRMRLLRMFHPQARPILKELADAYFQQFRRPLRVTSLTRSMDYQILLNAGNANSFVVRGEGSLPPHTSGNAFDLARKHMTAEEQNFVMNKLAEMERANKLDALIEYGINACFHVFIYHDGVPPKMAHAFSSLDDDSFPFLSRVTDTLGHNRHGHSH